VLVRLQFSGLLNTGFADHSIVGEGIQPGKEARLGTYMTITEGRQLAATDDYGIVLGEGVAKASNLAPGAYVTILANTPDGALNSLELEVVGVFRTFSKDYDDRAVRIPLVAAQELMASAGAHSLVLVLDEIEATDATVAALRTLIGDDGYEARSWLELADFYRKTVALYERLFGVLQLIILIMIVLSVANSVNMAIFERTGEYGTLMAIGDRPRDVFGLVMTENTAIGLAGASLGIALGVAIALAASAVGIPMPPPPNSNAGYVAGVQIEAPLLVVGFLVGATATVLAALLPARRASRLPIIDALRQNI
jgi:putative ABC transport system permease protein